MFSVVVLTVGAFEGDKDSISRVVTNLDVSGDNSVAFVNFGSASLAMATVRGFWGMPLGSVRRPMAFGVGVDGGAVTLLLARFLGGGVDGIVGAPVSLVEGLRFRLGGGSMVLPSGFASAWALRRDERRVAAMAREVVRLARPSDTM